MAEKSCYVDETTLINLVEQHPHFYDVQKATSVLVEEKTRGSKYS